MGPSDLLIPATERHAIILGSRLRTECKGVMVRAGFDPRRALIHAVRSSPDPQAWIHRGTVMGIGGVAGSTVGTEGTLWISLSEMALLNYPMTAMRLLRSAFSRQVEMWPRLVTAVSETDPIARRFAERFGFKPDGEANEYGMIPYVWERE